MKIRFVRVGKTKSKHWDALEAEYLKRLAYFTKYEIVEIKDDTKENEGKRILEKVNQSPFVCVLDVKGRSVSSHDLAKMIVNWQNRGLKEVAFVIGGAEGIASEVVETADDTLSLSFLTFTHEAARVILAEQIYRAYTIIKGFPYQK